jgi:hypothetical protein
MFALNVLFLHQLILLPKREDLSELNAGVIPAIERRQQKFPESLANFTVRLL